MQTVDDKNIEKWILEEAVSFKSYFNEEPNTKTINRHSYQDGYLAACRDKVAELTAQLEKRNKCSCKPMPHIDWCESCTWKEVHLECDKNEKLTTLLLEAVPWVNEVKYSFNDRKEWLEKLKEIGVKR